MKKGGSEWGKGGVMNWSVKMLVSIFNRQGMVVNETLEVWEIFFKVSYGLVKGFFCT